MAAIQEPLLDETVWTNPHEIQRLGGLNENTVHFYFSQSPFFDRSSKNGALLTQAQFNPSMAYILFNRDAFERRLQEMAGIEYLIASDTAELRAFPSTESNGIWVIRKQDRKIGSINADVEVLKTYFIVNNNVFMASSLGDIINNRLLTSTLAINKALSTVSNLAFFTPRVGHSYYPPIIRTTQTKDDSQSVSISREGSPIPEAQSQSRAQSPSAKASSDNPKPTQDTRALIASFKLSQSYSEDYIDENPLRGEPGAFVFSATTDRVKADRVKQDAAKRQKEENSSALRMQEAAVSSSAAVVSSTSKPGTPLPPSPGTQSQSQSQQQQQAAKGAHNYKNGLMTDSNAGTSTERKGSTSANAMKVKRRKSKPSLSPTSPVGQEMT